MTDIINDPIQSCESQNKTRILAAGRDRGRMPQHHNRAVQTTASSVEDSLGAWDRGIQGRGKRNPVSCGGSFKSEPKSQLEGLGWITTGFVLMSCGHQIASLLLCRFWLLRGQQVHAEDSQQRDSWSLVPDRTWRSAKYKSNKSHMTGTCNYIAVMDRQAVGERSLWHEVQSSGGNAHMSRTLLEPCCFSFCVGEWSTALHCCICSSIWESIRYTLRHRDEMIDECGWCISCSGMSLLEPWD